MSEKTLWTYLVGLLPRGQYTRIESSDTGPGFPDVDFILVSGHCGQIELKDAQHDRVPPFKDVDDGLHISQLNWIKERIKYGGCVWIVARVGRTMYWVPGDKASKFNGCADLASIAAWVLTDKITDTDIQAIRGMLEGGGLHGNYD